MKQLMITLIALFFGLQANAQVQFGVKAGVNFSTFDGDGFPDTDYRYSFTPAVFAKLGISDQFAFQPELRYASYGANYDDGTTTAKYILDQINMPLRFNFYTGKKGNAKGLKLNIGPQVGYTIKDEVKDDSISIDFSDLIESPSLAGDYSGLDLGATLGIGYEFENGLWIESEGFRSLIPTVEFLASNKNYNSAGSLTIGYNIGQNK